MKSSQAERAVGARDGEPVTPAGGGRSVRWSNFRLLQRSVKGKISKPRASEALSGAGPAASRGEREAFVRGVGPGSIDTTEESDPRGSMKRRYERTWSRWRVGSVATSTGWSQGC